MLPTTHTSHTSFYLSAQYGGKRALLGAEFSKVSSTLNSPAKEPLFKVMAQTTHGSGSFAGKGSER